MNNEYTDKDGNVVTARGQWKNATATLTLDANAEGGHHVNDCYKSDWAVVGHQLTRPHVIPETPLGTIIASTAMIAALGTYTIHHRKQKQTTN